MSRAIVIDDLSMINGDILGAPIEVLGGITASGHHSSDEFVGPLKGCLRIIDEFRLNRSPCGRKAFAVCL